MLSRAEWVAVGLTLAEAHVADLVCDGKSNKQIAEVRGTTESSVKFHITAINKKIGTSSRVAIVLKSLELANEVKAGRPLGPRPLPLPTGPTAS